MSDNFLTAELMPLSRNLSNLGSIGLRALEYLADGKSAPPDWVAEQLHNLQVLEQPVAEVRLGAGQPVRILLDALSRQASRPTPIEVIK
jgi:hypothetical protein